MSLLRKVLWPSAIALGLLVFFGAIGQSGVQVALASQGDICKVEGPYVKGVGAQGYMVPGDTALVVARIENNTGDVRFTDADLDQSTGNSNITSINRITGSGDSAYYQYRSINGVDHVENMPVFELTNAGAWWDGDLSETDEAIQQGGRYDEPDEIDSDGNTLNPRSEDILDRLSSDFGYKPLGDVCGDSVKKLLADCIREDDCDLFGRRGDHDSNEEAFGNWGDWYDDCNCVSVNDIAAAIDEALQGGELECDDLAEAAGDFLIGELGRWNEDFESDIFNLCAGNTGSDSWFDDLAIIDVTCVTAGDFQITFTEDYNRHDDEDEHNEAGTGTQRSIDIECRGVPAKGSTIDVRPSKVEIVPAMGSTSHSLVTVELLDEDSNHASFTGYEVDFTTNICSIETSGVDTADEFSAADSLFKAYSANVSSTSDAVEHSAAATSAVDSTRGADTVTAFDVKGKTMAAAVLGCGPDDTGSIATPGTATVTAVVEVLGGQDIILTKTVTVVGPPADLKVTASPSTLKCGEKATITATVKDSIGQNVSDHTRVEAVTNAGGVLGGTGAVAGLAGPVVPVASTVAETFDGVATFYLLTSDQHEGPYEVVVTTGGAGSVTTALGGVFSTRPEVAQQTVTCAMPVTAAPAPAPTISAPRTGTGTIAPPNTGDAGLLMNESSSTSWTLFAAAGAVVFAVAGLVTLKFARR